MRTEDEIRAAVELLAWSLARLPDDQAGLAAAAMLGIEWATGRSNTVGVMLAKLAVHRQTCPRCSPGCGCPEGDARG